MDREFVECFDEYDYKCYIPKDSIQKIEECNSGKHKYKFVCFNSDIKYYADSFAPHILNNLTVVHPVNPGQPVIDVNQKKELLRLSTEVNNLTAKVAALMTHITKVSNRLDEHISKCAV